MSEVSGVILGLVIGGALLWWVFRYPLGSLRRKTLNKLRSLSTEELERETFSCPRDYFEFLGESNPSVIRFREIAEARDLNALSQEWKSLEKDFRLLEHQAGHSGRPLIMDYFFWYDLNIKALRERQGS